MRRWFATTLGIWHPYKQAVLTVWRLGCMHFLGPLYHAISPGGGLYKKPKLITLVAFFSYIRMAYIDSNIAIEIEEAIQDKGVNAKHRYHLKNLQSLLEFFIPAVTDCISLLNNEICCG
jgi:hypothetical protein